MKYNSSSNSLSTKLIWFKKKIMKWFFKQSSDRAKNKKIKMNFYESVVWANYSDYFIFEKKKKILNF